MNEKPATTKGARDTSTTENSMDTTPVPIVISTEEAEALAKEATKRPWTFVVFVRPKEGASFDFVEMTLWEALVPLEGQGYIDSISVRSVAELRYVLRLYGKDLSELSLLDVRDLCGAATLAAADQVVAELDAEDAALDVEKDEEGEHA